MNRTDSTRDRRKGSYGRQFTLVIGLVALLFSRATVFAQADPEPKSEAPQADAAAVLADARVLQERNDSEIFRFNRPIVRIGQDFVLGDGEAVREIQSGLADITVAGQVDDDVVVVVGSLRLANTAKVGGSVLVIGGTLTIESGASIERDMIVIGGDLNAPAEFTPHGQQVVVGNIAVANTLHAFVPWVMRGLAFGRPIVPDLWWMWPIVGVFLFIYLMVNALFANHVRTVADTVSARPLSSFLLGLLVLVLTIPAIAILAATLIGIAVVPFVVCALVVAALIGKAGVMRATGRSVIGEDPDAGRMRAFVSLLIGFAVLTIAYMIPVLGFITWAITGAIGFGGAATAFRGALRREQPPRAAAPVVAEPAVVAEAGPIVTPQVAYTPPVSTFVPEAAAAGEPSRTVAAPPPSPVVADLTVYPRATFLDRVAAFALDAILVAIAVNVLELTRNDGAYPFLLLVYHVAFWAWRGTTLGGIIVGLRVIRVQGTDLRFVDALIRGLTAIFSIAAVGIGCFWMINDPEKQMWHDKIAGTLVVKVPRHLVVP